jgi:UDP-glucose 4-epimerase
MTLSGRHILVLGGGGFIGRHVVDAILAEGAEVRVLDLHKPADADPRINWLCGSLGETDVLATAAQGCDTAIYLAGHSLPAIGNLDVTGEISDHVVSSVRAAEVCAAQGVKRFLFSSSGGTVYGNGHAAPIAETAATAPMTAYGASKLAIEHYLRVVGAHQKMRAISLRIANPYGEGQRSGRGQGFIAAAMAAAFSGEELSIWGTGEVVRDFVYVADVAKACARACTYEGAHDLFNIGKGEGASLLEIVQQIEAASGRTINLRLCPERSIDVQRNVVDIARARAELGWSPDVSLEAGLTETAKWWSAQVERRAASSA